MAVTIQKIALWRKEVSHEPGVLAEVLEPLAAAGADLRVVMGYAIPGDRERAAIEVFPVVGRKVTEAARQAGLERSSIPCLLVEGANQPGLGARMARAIAERGVNISFLMAETVGSRFSAVFGFANEADARTAARAIRGVTAGAKGSRRAGGSAGRKTRAK